jgi:hypothetical protein
MLSVALLMYAPIEPVQSIAKVRSRFAKYTSYFYIQFNKNIPSIEFVLDIKQCSVLCLRSTNFQDKWKKSTCFYTYVFSYTLFCSSVPSQLCKYVSKTYTLMWKTERKIQLVFVRLIRIFYRLA